MVEKLERRGFPEKETRGNLAVGRKNPRAPRPRREIRGGNARGTQGKYEEKEEEGRAKERMAGRWRKKAERAEGWGTP